MVYNKRKSLQFGFSESEIHVLLNQIRGSKAHYIFELIFAGKFSHSMESFVC